MIVEEEQNGEKRAEYGKQQLQQISDYLTTHYGKGFDITNIRRIRLFYLQFPIRDTLCLELSWSYYRCLLHIENQEAISQNWSVRTLDRQISVLYYEQLLALQEKNLVIAEAKEKTEKLADNIKNYLRAPYILDFLNLSNKPYHESNVEESLINNIQHLLLELGKGFAFVEHQQRIRFDDEDFYINLVFYNFKLKYFLLIDIKLEKLKHQDIGQMDTNVRLYDEIHKGTDDNPTIGLVLCAEKSDSVAKYSVLADRKQLFAAKYLPYLPTKEELQKLINISKLHFKDNK
ncbi:PDDEXK nuclease domain-containing protein [Capnocytophaga sp. ARDL2]|uniref:PDDEXK nuclease domain-containing protein n=1 Tax=Capnocytophaga sp. ARDL2 TaxID=3238809 RepID=UPI0035565343